MLYTPTIEHSPLCYPGFLFRLLDLFCGAGGCTRGYQQAGFHVTGVDLSPQPRYCGDSFFQADALTHPLTGYDLIHASPPCQAHTALRTMHNAKPHLDLIAATRYLLSISGIPYVIENVVGAPLLDPTLLCGTMFGLGSSGAVLHRHRIFETSFPIQAPTCNHDGRPVIGIYGGHVRNRRRSKGSRGLADWGLEAAQEAMGINWMTLLEMSQAIPPAYTWFIGRQALCHVRSK